MKIRTGFVSNSSSSSFVVVFPSMPRSVAGTFSILFGKDNKEDALDAWYKTTKIAAAKRIFKDIPKNLNNKALFSLFQTKTYFYYSPCTYTFMNNRSIPINKFYRTPNPKEYYGTNPKLLREVYNLSKQLYYLNQRYHNRQDKIYNKYHWNEIKCYLLNNDTYFESCLEKDIMRTQIMNSKEMVKLENNLGKQKIDLEKTLDRKRNRLARTDMKKFLKDHENKFIRIFEYADEDGDGDMEHGDVFRNLVHIDVSHH